MKTKYIQRKRTKGWRLEKICQKLGIKRKDVVFCGRGSKWGNMHNICQVYPTKKEVVKAFEKTIHYFDETLDEIKKDLKGKVLMCWCTKEDFDNELCHCYILWKIANEHKED